MSSLEQRVVVAKREIRARSMDGWQRRSVPSSVQVRDAGGGGYGIVGHGAVFNSLSEDLGGFREQISPGAFASVLTKRPDVRALFNHDPNLILAATRNGTLDVGEDFRGLGYDARVTPAIAATYYGQAMRAQLSEGLVTQSSFAFRVAAGGDSWDEDDEDTGGLIRTILPNGVSGLFDVSPVVYPAYAAADSGLAMPPMSAASARASQWRLKAVRRSMAAHEAMTPSLRRRA